jgi:type II secretory pathway predicted ATPase ExeA
MPLRPTWLAREAAFADRAGLRAPFESAAFRGAVFSLTEGLDSQRRLILLVGDKGSGKTTLLRSLRLALAAETRPVRYYGGCAAREILSTLTQDFDTGDCTKVQDRQSLPDALLDHGAHAVLLVDDVDELAMQEIQKLADVANAQYPFASPQVVVACDEVCSERGHFFEFSDIGGRLIVPLGPLTPEEVVFYVQHQLTGTRQRHVRFERGALLKVFAYSGGNPGQINRICARALCAKAPVVCAADIDEAAAWCGLTEASETTRLTVAWFGGPQPAAATPPANVRSRSQIRISLFAAVAASSIGLLYFGLGLETTGHDSGQPPEATRGQERRSDSSGASPEVSRSRFYTLDIAQSRSHEERANIPLSVDEVSEPTHAYSPAGARSDLEAVGALSTPQEFASTAPIQEISPATTVHGGGAQGLDQSMLSASPGEARKTEFEGDSVQVNRMPNSSPTHSILPGAAADVISLTERRQPASSPDPQEPGTTNSALVSSEETKVDHRSARETKSLEDKIARLPSPPEPTRKQTSGVDVQQLMRRGIELMQSGDIAAARLFLQRAAATGHPEAYTALGQTYDPIELRRRNVIGISADIDAAMKWYREGERAGDRNARERLAELSAFVNR